MITKSTPVLLLADDGQSLIRKELAHAFTSLGWHVHTRNTVEITQESLAKMLTLPPERSQLPSHPKLFCSVNFQGLDKHGEIYDCLKKHGIPVVVWCVDNPWNLLSGLRAPFWKDLFLFVTDASFIPALKDHGAAHVYHLPLAASPELFRVPPQTPPVPHVHPLLFVGRSAFPDKDRFFTGQSVPDSLLQQGLNMVTSGQRSDFSWWVQTLGLGASTAPLWPGSAVRTASLGAETCSLAWRTQCLNAALPTGLTLVGDAGWNDIFASTANAAHLRSPELLPPVDYYTRLPALYAAAPFTINVTSLLLPAGLTQRHFDVWAVGGFCLTDATPGLGVFPEELTTPITYTTPDELPEKAAYFTAHPQEKEQLAKRWHAHIMAEHCYTHRACAIIDTVFSE